MSAWCPSCADAWFATIRAEALAEKLAQRVAELEGQLAVRRRYVFILRERIQALVEKLREVRIE